MAGTAIQTAHLDTWSEVSSDNKWPTLLVGNGASVNLWSGFAYPSLYERADLSTVTKAIFAHLEVTNFETVLEAIHHAHVVAEALEDPTDEIDIQYEQVKSALFSAVHDAHVGWSWISKEIFDAIASVIQNHDSVYTTNYDLCMYWARVDAANRTGKQIGIDFFWGDGYTFDPDSVEIRERTALYYLHGAIHLWQDDHGNNGKWTSAHGGKLLSLASKYSPQLNKWPLFVSEGTSKAKLQTIGRSPYLTFCLDSLSKDLRDTVIFGHALCEQDKHIVTALKDGPPRKIAISIFPYRSAQWIIQEKARITGLLGEHNVSFFDSTTHPLGDPSLAVDNIDVV